MTGADIPVLDRLRTMTPALSVGVLTADWMSLGTDLAMLEKAGVALAHFDVMDGRFCPMMTFGPPVIKALKTPLLKDVHLLIEEPLDTLESYVAAGADLVTISVEACRHPHRALQALKQMANANDPARGIVRGVTLNPGTPLEAAEPLLDEVDMVVLLAVNPGWSGQKFIRSTPQRIRRLIAMIRAAGRDILIGLDGGVTRDNIDDVARMGADIIVTGSAVFDGKNPAANARYMIEAAVKARCV
jgi:ribulose-phosphate 3-epimerase